MKTQLKRKVVTLSILMFISASWLHAQEAPYKYGIGVNVLSMEAVSFKAFMSPKLAIEMELGYKWTYPGGRQSSAYGWGYGYYYSYYLPTLELSPNFVYQSNIKDWQWGRLDYLVGGGLSIGYTWWWGRSGKLGLNAIGGVELKFNKIPLAVQTDFRPGYGMVFRKGFTYHFFDWGINISARYCFGKK
ncbi:MAG: hypothetical protein LBR36_08425 [Bacteroidales bacterium]|jgi:hypothetical protein|nr:hypothetical protein [Bacteroidales bacterium]